MDRHEITREVWTKQPISGTKSGNIGFSTNGDELEIVDRIERHRYKLNFEDVVEPKPADLHGFPFPIDRSVMVDVSQINLPYIVAVQVRNPEGSHIEDIEKTDHRIFKEDRYLIEINGPVKLYLSFESPFKVVSDGRIISIQFNHTVVVKIGARSNHTIPPTTLKVTSDPEDLMKVISTFGSSLITLSPERSFPTLRGHPPLLVLDTAVSIPSWLKPPKSNITIEVPPEFSSIMSASPLAYYVGANLSPGNNPVLRTDSDDFSLICNGSLEEGVERTLKQVFLLDCITRCDGLYPVDVEEREILETRVDVDFKSLYEDSISSRISSYLDIPYEIIEDLVPDWGLIAYVDPDPKSIECLPYLVDDLALIRVRSIEEFDEASQKLSLHESFDRSSTNIRTYKIDKSPDVAEQVWVGDGSILGTSKAIPAGFEHRFNIPPTEDPISVAVACNDGSMDIEQSVLDSIYSRDDDLEFTLYHNLCQEDLQELIMENIDYFHYIGHIDEDGFECSDGKLDLTSLDETNISSFFLNACESFVQGELLVELGAIGGIVTIGKISNIGAVSIGAAVARLLDLGFPLYASLDIAQEQSIMGSRYTVIGDGRIALRLPISFPILAQVTENKPGFDVEVRSFPTSILDLGSLTKYHLGQDPPNNLLSSPKYFSNVSEVELIEFFERERFPVRIGEEHSWSDEINIGDLNRLHS